MTVHIPITLLWLAGCIALTLSLAVLAVVACCVYLYFAKPGIGILEDDFQEVPFPRTKLAVKPFRRVTPRAGDQRPATEKTKGCLKAVSKTVGSRQTVAGNNKLENHRPPTENYRPLY